MRNAKILAAEAVGTFVLMLGGPGSAVLATGGFFGEGSIGVLGVSLAFGLALLIIAYSVGPVSGGHVNPAVTVGMALMRKIKPSTIPSYLSGQAIGAIGGGAVVYAIANSVNGFDATNNFAANGWGDFSPGGFGFGAMVITEIVMTAVLMFVVLSTTRDGFNPGAVGLHVGMALALIHLISIPIDNTSVNPARSFGAALFAGSDALGQLWAFVVFPILGAVVGVLAWLAVDDASLEDTVLGDSALVDVRDRAVKARDAVADSLDRG